MWLCYAARHAVQYSVWPAVWYTVSHAVMHAVCSAAGSTVCHSILLVLQGFMHAACKEGVIL